MAQFGNGYPKRLLCRSESKFILDVPWAVSPGNRMEANRLFPSSEEYYAKNCVVKKDEKPASQSIQALIKPTFASPEMLEYEPSTVAGVEDGQLSLVYKGKDHAFFVLADGKTGVWVRVGKMISHFSPPNDTETLRWASDMTHGLKALEDNGAKRLIIDVTNNGGGIICLGCAAAYFIAPWESKTCYRYDVRLSEPMEQLFYKAFEVSQQNSTFDASVFNMTEYGHLKSFKQIKTPHELLNPGRLRKRGGVQGKYTNLFTLDHLCLETLNQATNPKLFPQLKQGWKVKDIALLSNGLCGSTCSNFARTLRDKHGIASYTYGGSRKGRFQPSAFEGGMVVEYDSLDLVGISPIIPGAPTMATLQFPVRGRIPFFEVYPDYDKKGKTPAEWIPQDSEYYVDGVLSLDFEGIWNKVSKMIGLKIKEEDPDNLKLQDDA
ncbi:UNVERIFIED_CONTAM: hypothetical protein HDU68_006290 [Siphonaria sp. JEL0065]|nr:hypothetical protein HDU68_006290 [Siphonaria sp. JEL0065]